MASVMESKERGVKVATDEAVTSAAHVACLLLQMRRQRKARVAANFIFRGEMTRRILLWLVATSNSVGREADYCAVRNQSSCR